MEPEERAMKARKLGQTERKGKYVKKRKERGETPVSLITDKEDSSGNVVAVSIYPYG
jgi:hypothetical protein